MHQTKSLKEFVATLQGGAEVDADWDAALEAMHPGTANWHDLNKADKYREALALFGLDDVADFAGLYRVLKRGAHPDMLIPYINYGRQLIERGDYGIAQEAHARLSVLCGELAGILYQAEVTLAVLNGRAARDVDRWREPNTREAKNPKVIAKNCDRIRVAAEEMLERFEAVRFAGLRWSDFAEFRSKWDDEEEEAEKQIAEREEAEKQIAKLEDQNEQLTNQVDKLVGMAAEAVTDYMALAAQPKPTE